jgi:short-subunit dehydrogenase
MPVLKNYALVTGAANGIGKAIAFQLAGQGYDLLLVDIDQDLLTDCAAQAFTKYNRRVEYKVVDLASERAAADIFAWSQPFHPYLTILVNNAGYGLHGPFSQLSLDEQLEMLRVNILAVVRLSHIFIPVLKDRERSYLLNVSSTTAYQSVPFLTMYSASKVFVLSFTRSLRRELEGTPVSVSCLCPGSTDTNFVHRARMNDRVKATAIKFNMTPARVAEYAVNGMFSNKTEIIPGFINKLNAWLPRYFNKSLAEKVALRIYKP